MADNDSISIPSPAVGTGRYSYLLDGEDAGIEEVFEVSGDGTSIVSRRTAPGATVLSVSVERTGILDARCRLSLRRDGNEDVSVLYVLADGELDTQHSDGSPTPTVVPSGPAVLSPLMRVFQGPAIAEVIRAGGECAVVVPALDTSDPANLLLPTVQTRRAERLGVEAVGTGEHSAALRRCRYVGGSYDDSAEFWLDDRDRLVRYRFAQDGVGIWDVELVDA